MIGKALSVALLCLAGIPHADWADECRNAQANDSRGQGQMTFLTVSNFPTAFPLQVTADSQVEVNLPDGEQLTEPPSFDPFGAEWPVAVVDGSVYFTTTESATDAMVTLVTAGGRYRLCLQQAAPDRKPFFRLVLQHER